MYLYRGTGRSAAPFFSARLSMGTGYQNYDLLG